MLARVEDPWVRVTADVLSLLCTCRIPRLLRRNVQRHHESETGRKAAKTSSTRKHSIRIAIAVLTFALFGHYLGCGFFHIGTLEVSNLFMSCVEYLDWSHY
jgi:hypothetical protein